MNKLSAATFALILIGLGNAALTADQQNSFIALHNRLRSAIQPTAANMMALSWDNGLAQSAQASANRCPSSHGPPTSSYGENIAWGWPAMTVDAAFQKWSAEKNNYNPSSSQCSGGQQCQHYTQLIHGNTTSFGCGMNTCALFGQSSVQTYVCHYYTPGNVVGQAPYTPGPSCSMCPNATTCVSNLCASNPNANLFPDPQSPVTTAPSTAPSPAAGPTAAAPGQPAPAVGQPASAVGQPASPGQPAAPGQPAVPGQPAAAGHPTPGTTGQAMPASGQPGQPGAPTTAGQPMGGSPGVVAAPTDPSEPVREWQRGMHPQRNGGGRPGMPGVGAPYAVNTNNTDNKDC
ncbi:SCP domain-containing protein [Plasmodiophora brassicae]|nr:hypothetical protein PBRA_002783 [Plasmodiophora brassicae]